MNGTKLSCFLASAVFAGAVLAGCPDDREGDGILRPPDTLGGDDTAADTVDSDVTVPKLETGEACIANDDCESNLCLDLSSGGKICSQVCTAGAACPNGLVCVVEGEAGLCVKADVVSCQPCKVEADCNVGGLSGNKCVSYGDDGSFCGQSCAGGAACPDGYACTDGACKKSAGECTCNAAGIRLAAETTCAVSNEFGSCEGQRGCGAGGLSRCYADTPAAESCNGHDDDCDGDTDEGTDGQQCDLTNEFGVCHGTVECTDGKPLCVGKAPAAEICNGVDDNCNGETDEGSEDLDNDDIADCLDPDWDNDGTDNVDDCQPRNPAVHPGATDTCNGIDDDCDHRTDNGEASGCGCYVCGGVAGCLTACDDNDDVDEGFVCDSGDFDHDENTHECLPSVCGNGDVEAGELCDDGENIGAYGGCFACQELGPFCGDGRRQFEFELCDDGELNGTHGHCNNTCDGPTPPECGDGFPEGDEECDLGAAVNSNAPNALCRTDCTVRRCGDGITDPANEEACDAGGANGEVTCGCTKTCQFPSNEVVCRGVQGQCDIADTCNGNGACGADVKQNGVQCRGATGDCDVAEACNGVSNDCPADAKAPTTKTCREATGLCDIAEKCDGTSKICPGDQIHAPGFECRPSVGDCDSPEECDGETGACPEDSFFGNDTPCRESAGGCDVTEYCEGNSTVCPDDFVFPNGFVCHDANGTCDQNATCDGVSGVCEYGGFLGEETVCRGAIGDCDAEERCPGDSADCPADQWDDNTTVCREAGGICDRAESCTGDSPFCPDDSFFGHETTCRGTAGDCDFAETCEGNSTECPSDLVADNGTICHAAEGDCDQNVTCNGSSGVCDYTGFLPVGTVCREALPWNTCDQNETCSGTSGACPEDAYFDNTTVCRPADGDCDVADFCTGFLPFCLGDQLADNSTVCRAGDGFCDPEERCSGQSRDCGDDFVEDDGVDCSETPDCNGAPCSCSSGECISTCGDGIIQENEACDDGRELNGQRDHCNSDCSATCGGDANWVRNVGGFSDDAVYAVAVDGDGNSYAAGFYGESGIPQAPDFFSVQVGDSYFQSQGNDDTFVMATASDNTPIWAACAGGFDNDTPYGIGVDGDGVWIAGTFSDVMRFGCCDYQPPTAPGLDEECPEIESGGGSSDSQGEVFVARYDKETGALQWAEHGGGAFQFDDVYEVGVSAARDAVVVGVTNGPEGISFGDQSDSTYGFYDGFVVSYDANGNVRWLHTVGGEGYDWVDAVTRDGSAASYIVGGFEGNVTIGDDSVESDADVSSDIFVAKLDDHGEVLWLRAVGAELGLDFANPEDIAYGCVSGEDGAAPECTVYVLAGDSEIGGWVISEMDPETGVQRTRDLHPGGGSYPFGLVVDRAGAVTIAGRLSGGDDLQGAPGAFIESHGSQDGFIGHRDPGGTWAWGKAFGGDKRDYAYDLGVGDDGSVYVGGELTEWGLFDDQNVTVYSWQSELMFEDDVDGFVAKFAPSTNGCFVCGNGQVDPGETCDDADERSDCAGTCNGLCTGDANTCGDGWAECGEDYDDASGSADAGMCTIVTGRVWCFQQVNAVGTALEYTYNPTDVGGTPVILGPGVKEVGATSLKGNTQQPEPCADSATPSQHLSGAARQWGGDQPRVGTNFRFICDGNPQTPLCDETTGTCVFGRNEAAARECGDYYEFRARTGDEVAFEFDLRNITQGPTGFSLWVKIGHDDTFVPFQSDSYEKVYEGSFSDMMEFPDAGLPTGMISVDLTDYDSGGGPLTNQEEVSFRLYAWGNQSTDSPFVIDNVRVGAPSRQNPIVPSVFIDEIHYDNTGTDAGEGVEIVAPPGTDFTGWKVVPYNGGGNPTGQSYTPAPTLSGTLFDTGYGVAAKWVPITGLQNGVPDGVALVNPAGTVVQFLSYGGAFTASNGAANGQTAVDIGVVESGTTAVGQSLQLTGAACAISDFTWSVNVTASPGLFNLGASFRDNCP